MTWRPLGSVVMDATSDVVSFGTVGADLTDRTLFLRFRTVNPSNPTGLAFAIVQPVADTDGGGLPESRYYPSRYPTTLAIGPSVLDTFDGIVRMRCRRYNTRWLKTGYPSRTWRVEADAWVPAGVVLPWFNPAGFTDGAQLLSVSSAVVGPGEAAPLTYV